MIARLARKLSPSTSSPPLPVGSPPKEPPPRRRRQGRRRGQIAAARAPDVLCRRGAPRRACKPPAAAISPPPPRRRRPPRASGPRRCVKNLHPTDAHRREHDISSTLCAEECGQRIGAGLGMAWRLTSRASSAPAHAPPAKIDYRPPATCALGSALGSEDVGGVGGLLLDLGAFFARQLPPEGQVGGFSRRPSPLNRSAVAAGV